MIFGHSDLELNIISITTYETKCYRHQVNLSSAVILIRSQEQDRFKNNEYDAMSRVEHPKSNDIPLPQD